jgi:MoaA/NifB/PqqE/SkfB family radical SAM enzyme
MAELNPIEKQRREKLRREHPYIYDKIIRQEQKYQCGGYAPTIQIQYNYACNMNCEHCCVTNLEKGRRTLTPKSFADLARQADALDITHFTISGGEPLLFRDLPDVVKAIDPEKFFVAVDTNGWLLTEERARELKALGVGKMNISLDSARPVEHDAFRRKQGAYAHAVAAIKNAQNAGLLLQVNTVLTKQRARSDEFIEFLEQMKQLGATTALMFARPIGEWAGNVDILLNDEDIEFTKALEKKYCLNSHLTRNYGIDFGCLAVKRLIAITRYGDVQPCFSILVSLGNIFDEPLKDILERGMTFRCFKEKSPTCLACVDRKFVKKYNERTIGKQEPLPWQEFFGADDRQ